ncbi:MAG TPA: Imm50 family immunity protein, partial [Verrucomicrobiae bacterium]|nr:Imm50 family immunity protein [Verrucomicrobiae bacterium]
MKPDIENAEALASIFGRWPSFHDAEVWSLTYERTPKGFDVTATIHVFEMTSEVDARGFYRLQKHTRVILRFADCLEAGFQWFNHQNVLSELLIEPADNGGVPSMRAIFASSYGLDGELFC